MGTRAMAGPISMDLRERASERLDQGRTVREVAEELDIAPSSVVKWSQLRVDAEVLHHHRPLAVPSKT